MASGPRQPALQSSRLPHHSCPLTSSLPPCVPVPKSGPFRVPALVPPNCFVAFGLQCCHNDVHVIVPVSQHALLVRSHHGVRRQPADVKGGPSLHYQRQKCALHPSPESPFPPLRSAHCSVGWAPPARGVTPFYAKHNPP